MTRTAVRSFLALVLILATLPAAIGPAGADENPAGADIDPQIVGGAEADPGEYPYMTALLRVTAQGSLFDCGASLIAPTWVLTAAHCVENRSAAEVEFLVGHYDLAERDGQEQAAAQVIMHPGYSQFDYPNDIALVELVETQTAPLMALATAADAVDIPTATVIGWGDTQSALGFPDILREVDVPILSDAACLASGIGDLVEPDVMVCAGTTGRDSCGGDSGGPLIITTSSGVQKQLGVVSFGEGCAEPNQPGVYVEIPAFREWIESHTGPLGSGEPPVDVSSTCEEDGGRIVVKLTNTGTAFASYATTIGDRPTRQTSMSSGASTTVSAAGLPNGLTAITVVSAGQTVYDAATTIDCAPPVIAPSPQVAHAVSCLAGNGRVDTNVVNTSDSEATYRLEFEGLTPRQRTVAAGDWWRSPITGRADGSYVVVMKREGVVVSTTTITVECDSAVPTVSDPEVQVINACRGGNGYILFQFVNSSEETKPYVIEFEGVNNRSTSAAGFGASVRAVTGRGDGNYEVLITSVDVDVATMTLSVTCDGNLG